MWLGNASRTVAIPLPATTYTWNVYKGNVMSELTESDFITIDELNIFKKVLTSNLYQSILINLPEFKDFIF